MENDDEEGPVPPEKVEPAEKIEAPVSQPHTLGDLIGSIKEKAAKHEFDKAEKDISTLKMALAAAAKGDQMKKLARNMITATKTIFTRLKDFGLDLDSERETFKRAILAIKNQEFIKGCQLTLKTKAMLERAQRDYINRSLARPKEFLQDVRISDYFIANEKEAMERSLVEIESLFNANEYKDSFNKLKEYLVKETSIKIRLQKVEQHDVFAKKVNELVETADNYSIDIAEENDTRDKIEVLMSEKNVEEALPLLEDVLERLGKKINAKIIEDARSNMEKAMGLLKENVELLDQVDLEMRLENARARFEAEEYLGSNEISEEVIGIIDNALNDKRINELRESLIEVETMVAENERMGAYILRSEAYLYKAKFFFEKQKYDESLNMAKEAEKSTIIARKEFYTKNITSTLEEGQVLIKEAHELGLDTSEFDTAFNNVEDQFSKGKLEESNTAATGSMAKLTEVIYHRLQDMIGKEFPPIQEVLEQAKAIEVDVTEEIEELLHIEELNREGKYREAIQKVEELKQSVNNKIQIRKKELNAQKIETAKRERLTLEEETGKEYPDLQTYIDSAINAFANDERDALESSVREFYRVKEEHYDQFRQEQYQKEIKELEAMVSEMKLLGIELPGDLIQKLEELKKMED